MNFSYQNYVRKMEYTPYAWPPDISLAGLHSRCSEPGKENPVGVSCPCCGYTIKLKIESWIKRDIYQDFQETGAGIPAYFGLLRFYNLVVLLVFVVNAPYFMYAMHKACNLQHKQCVSIGFIRYLQFSSMIKILSDNSLWGTINALMILQTVVFYILLVANNLSIFYLVYISRKCKVVSRSTKRFMTLIVENLPQFTPEDKIKSLLVLPNGENPKISSVTFVKSLYAYNEIFRERILTFFQLKALCIECIDPKRQQKKNQALKKLDSDYNMRKSAVLEDNGITEKAIVMFEDHEELMMVYEKYHYREIQHWGQRIYNFITKSGKKTDVFVNFLPQLDETLWVNLGEDHKIKFILKLVTLASTILLLLGCYALFYYPLLYMLEFDSSEHEQTKLTLWQKFFPTLIALALVGMSIFFRIHMERLSKQRFPRTHNQKSQYVLTTTIMFQLIFYLIIPTIFFKVDNGIYGSVKLFAISSQARTFIIIQLILSFIDSIYRIWKMKKDMTLADQREAFKYPQKLLHEKVQYQEYPIEIKLIVMFKIWSLVLFYSFFVPIIMFYVVVAMIILYFLEKRNIYHHYVVRKHLPSKLQIKFLNIYINFFCIYQCFIYIVNVTSRWQQILAGVSTIVSLLLQLIYWQILKKREMKKQRHKIMKAENDIRKSRASSFVPPAPSKKTDPLQEQLIQSQKDEVSEDEEDSDDPTYGSAYKRFLEQYHQPQLDEQIQNYLQSIKESEQTKEKRAQSHESFHQPQRKSRVQTVIQMA